MKRTIASLAPLLFAGWVAAAPYEILHAFSGALGEPDAALIAGADGRLYGTAMTAGVFGLGCVYALTPDGLGGYTFEELHAFAGADGEYPRAPLVEASDGGFLGTTVQGGTHDLGTVFSMDRDGSVTTLHSFSGIGGEGAQSLGGLIEAPDGYFYGTTFQGGLSGLGTVFRIDQSGNLVTLHGFLGYPTEGAYPYAGLVSGGDGYFYGTTNLGGTDDAGSVFRIDPSGDFSTVVSLDSVHGIGPQAGLVRASNGDFYGVAPFGGASQQGTIFRVASSGGLATVHDFQFAGGAISTLIEASDGQLYGTTIGTSVVYRLDPNGNDYEVFYDFNAGLNSLYPWASLLELPDGRFVGALGDGRIYAVSGPGSLDELYRFREPEGKGAWGGLIQANDGDLYGTTMAGGELGGWGTVFRLTLDGALTTLHSFDGADGFGPIVRLLEASNGFFYGTTIAPGSGAYGNIFQMNPAGDVTSLFNFGGLDGAKPDGGLIEGPDGAFYGATTDGGENGLGTIYRIDAAGSLATLHDFVFADGAHPEGSLVSTGGSLWGTTANAGGGYGTVYSLDGANVLTTAWTFAAGLDGIAPMAGLLLASDGDFYGTTTSSIFRIGTTGPLTPLHSFSGTDATAPRSALSEGTDGAFYGTAETGGSGNLGTIFRIDALGDFTTLHDFANLDGSYPHSGVLQASNGDFYGTTSWGGAGGGGVVFRLAAAADLELSAIIPTSGRAAGATAITLEGTHVQPFPTLLFGGVGATDVIDVDAETVRAMSPGLPPGTLHDVVLTNPDFSTDTLPNAWFADFLDVPSTNLFHDAIEAIVRASITAGCGAGDYCPDNPVTRAQMAVFLLKAEHGSAYVPPPCAGIFDDVPCPGGFAVDWIERLADEGVTAGCGGNDYCPGDAVTRAQMSVFLLKTLLTSAYVPPVVAQIFEDVPPGAFAYDWINDLYGRGVTGGCSASPLLYCPDNPNTRGQMAVFLVRTFGL